MNYRLLVLKARSIRLLNSLQSDPDRFDSLQLEFYSLFFLREIQQSSRLLPFTSKITLSEALKSPRWSKGHLERCTVDRELHPVRASLSLLEESEDRANMEAAPLQRKELFHPFRFYQASHRLL